MRGSVSPYDVKGGKHWYYTFPNCKGCKPPNIKQGGFKTRKAAHAAMQAEMVARRRHDWIEPCPQPLGAFLDDWLASAARTIAPSTVHNYGKHVQRISRELGNVPLGMLTLPDIDAAYARLAKRYAPSTMSVLNSVLSLALDHAVARRLRHDNPADHARTPAAERVLETVWTAEEAARFLRETADDQHHALWRLLLSTGMRFGEALALMWPVVDLDAGRCAVVRTISRNAANQDVIVERTKTDSGRRTLTLEPATVSALRAHRIATVERQLRARYWTDTGLVFAGRNGGIRSADGLRDRLLRACDEADVPPLTPKAMRHTAATLMVADGVPLHAVKGILGHASIQITADLYSHHSPDATRKGLSALARVLEGDNTQDQASTPHG